MKKKMCLFMALSLTVVSFVGCSGEDTSDSSKDSSYENSDYDDSGITNYSSSSFSGSYNSNSSSSNSNSSSKTIEHYCDADGCYKEGTRTMTGISGETEYYCQEHYNKIQEIIGDMEKDVGNGSASTHQCEECSKEGTHQLIGLSGETEYYCTEHYNQIVEIIEMMQNRKD